MANSVHDGHRERMKARFLKSGLDSFDPHQILEMLLFYVIPRRDTNPIAHNLLDRFGSLSGVLDADFEHLCQVEGISKQAALFLTFCSDLVGQYEQSKVQTDQIFKNIGEIHAFLKAKYINEKVEKLRIICLDNRGKLLNCSVISEGNVNATDLNLRALIETVVRYPTTTVVMAHNHPSGLAKPSEQDLNSTRLVKATLQSMGIRLVDHLIFAQDGFISLRTSPRHGALFASDLYKTPASILFDDE